MLKKMLDETSNDKIDEMMSNLPNTLKLQGEECENELSGCPSYQEAHKNILLLRQVALPNSRLPSSLWPL